MASMSKQSSAGEKGMIFLEAHHPIILETLTGLMGPDGKHEAMDQKICDFDDVEYHILVTPEEKDVVKVSMRMKCATEMLPMGLKAKLELIFGKAFADKPEPGYHVTLVFKPEEVRKSPDAKQLIKHASELKRLCITAPLERCLEALAKGQSDNLKPMQLSYRAKESIYIAPSKDRVLVFLSLDFMGDTDRAIALVFLNSFTEAQRKNQSAPPVQFSTKPQNELKQAFASVKEGDPSLVGYIFFSLTKMHVDKPGKIQNVAHMLTSFRSYLHYHIKASKTYLQSRMRMRCELMLKVLNRANPDTASIEAGVGRRNTTTTTGKTFRKF